MPPRRLPSARARRDLRGQALIEFAIVLLVLMALIVGGIELGTAALASRGLRDGVQTAGDGWAQAIQRFAQTEAASSPLRPVLHEICAASAAVTAGSAPGSAACDEAGAYPPSGTATVPGYCGLGSHEADGFSMPNCIDADCATPDPGLPDHKAGDADYPARCDPLLSDPSQASHRLDADHYLFNPKPLDVTACAPGGVLQARCVDRLFSALPPLHNAVRNLYQTRCTDAALNEVVCDAAAARWLLRLPGRLDPGTEDVRLAQVAEGGANGLVSAGPPLATFQLQCVAAGEGFAACTDAEDCPCDRRSAPADRCWSQATSRPYPLACDIRVVMRYRHSFFSAFPTGRFDERAVVDPTLLDHLDLGIGGAGGLGAEVVSQGAATGNPSYFKVPWKTFRGCTETRSLFSPAASAVGVSRQACS